MAFSEQTRSGDQAETFKSEGKVLAQNLRVAMPGIIQSFDADAVTAVVQPAIRCVETDNDGNRTTRDYPLLTDVPVVFPRGGGCTLTFPVNAGDECLVIFADRCIDFWWQSGGVQEPVDDGIEVSDEDAITFNGSNEPTGKMLDYQNGKLCWVDRPAPEMTKEQLIAIAEGKRESLIDQAMQSISVIQLKLQAGRKLTTAETEKINSTLDYIDAVTAIDTATAPDINWPERTAV
ncbi:Gp138 family membrane-puncturing spike protein [Enterobacter roggenkampii]|uniref:Gp138 family membrane-puncturing spike protein n=1 Tax=Enterobacter roggenkampii TaxID=1812935 RepID=UPI00321914F4